MHRCFSKKTDRGRADTFVLPFGINGLDKGDKNLSNVTQRYIKEIAEMTAGSKEPEKEEIEKGDAGC